MEPSQALLRDRFDYRDGKLLYRYQVPRNRIGSAAGCKSPQGYRVIGLNYKLLKAHRLIWIWHNGPIPTGRQIDHIDHDRTNDRIENLRLVTCAGNNRNKSVQKNSPTGVTGIRYRQRYQHWEVSVKPFAKRRKYIGWFKTFDEALEARNAAYSTYGYHPSHGIKKGEPKLPSNHAASSSRIGLSL